MCWLCYNYPSAYNKENTRLHRSIPNQPVPKAYCSFKIMVSVTLGVLSIHFLAEHSEF